MILGGCRPKMASRLHRSEATGIRIGAHSQIISLELLVLENANIDWNGHFSYSKSCIIANVIEIQPFLLLLP